MSASSPSGTTAREPSSVRRVIVASLIGTSLEWYWYAEHLGVDGPPPSYDDARWQQMAGPTVFAPFPSDSEHFGNDAQQWAINFRVRDLDAMVSQLRDAGLTVDVHEQDYPNGRFADLVYPEGNPIQLWEPAGIG